MALRTSTRRRLATGVNAALVTAMLCASVVLGQELARRADVHTDVSADGRSTLSPDLRIALTRIDERGIDVEILAFSHPNQGEDGWYRDRVLKDVLGSMDRESTHVSTRFVDLDADRLTAENLGVSRYGTVVVRTQDDRVDIADRDLFQRRAKDASTFVGQGRLVAALTEMMSDRRNRIYALTGHGERTIHRQGQGELVSLSRLVAELGYDLRPLELLSGEGPTSVPVDASAVLVLRPTVPLTPTENDALVEYVRDGGRVVLSLDPGVRCPEFAASLGIDVPEGTVLDEDYRYPDPFRPQLGHGRHPITEDLRGDPPILVDVLRVAPIVTTGGAWTPLLTTSRRGWIERDAEVTPSYTEGRDGPGPVLAAAALEGPKGARVVVLGDSDLLTDPFLDTGPGNATFVANTLRWVVGADDQMSAVQPSHPARPLVLSTAQRTRLRWLLTGAWPLFWLGLGAIVVTLRRRR